MSRSSRVALLALIAVVAVAGIVLALASSGLLAHRSAGSLEELQGTYVSTTEGSATPQPLVEGRPVRLVIADDRLGANAGCNQMGGDLSVENGVLVVGALVQTEMACEPAEVMDQEAWVRDMLQARPRVEATDDRLVLRWLDYVLVLDELTSAPGATTPTATDQPLPSSTTPVPGTSGPGTASPGPGPLTPGSPSLNTIPETPEGTGG